MTTFDATTAANPRPPVGTPVVLHVSGVDQLAVVTDHPRMYPALVLVATEADLRGHHRLLMDPAMLTAMPATTWDAAVLTALAVVAP